jgi:hypothetical protein
MKQKRISFEKKSKMADSEKLSFSKSPILNILFVKISWIGPWLVRIDWCKEQ